MQTPYFPLLGACTDRPAISRSEVLAALALASLVALVFAPRDARAAVEVQCGALEPVSGRVCAVAPGTDGGMLVQGDVLGPYQIFRGGGVAFDASGEITCAGCGCSAPDSTVVRCPDAVVSPGLINAYDHLTFSFRPPVADTGERYEQRHDWRRGQRGHTQLSVAGGATANQIRWTELRQLISGTTSIVGNGGAAGLARNLDSSLQGLGLPIADTDTFPLDDSNGTQQSSGCAYGVITTAAAVAAQPAYLAVVAEGIDAVARNEFLCLSSGLNGGQDLVQPQASFSKSIALTTADFSAMAAEGTGLVWSPRSNLRLYGDTARATTAPGVDIALSTDWSATGSMNLLRELRCADAFDDAYQADYFSQEDLWRMATRNAAMLTATESEIGTLSVGRKADLAVFDASFREDYDAIIDAEPSDVALVLRAGTVLFGEAPTVAEIPNTGTCDLLDVCGADRRVCLLAEVGQTLASLTSANGTSYPLFFCGVPDNEPTCTPMRSSSVNGSTVYDGTSGPGDLDGDAIADASDNCPTVFNPIRPLDDGLQPDADDDDLGDACDPTVVPEPGMLGGLVAGVALLGAGTRSRRARTGSSSRPGSRAFDWIPDVDSNHD